MPSFGEEGAVSARRAEEREREREEDGAPGEVRYASTSSSTGSSLHCSSTTTARSASASSRGRRGNLPSEPEGLIIRVSPEFKSQVDEEGYLGEVGDLLSRMRSAFGGEGRRRREGTDDNPADVDLELGGIFQRSSWVITCQLAAAEHRERREKWELTQYRP